MSDKKMKSILENIKNAVESIQWSSQTKKEKALNLSICIYNLYIYDGGDFNLYKSLSKNYFLSIIKTKNYLYEIKDNLINSGILEVYKNGTYILGKKNKCYRFNQELISGNYVALNGPKIKREIDNAALNGPKSIIQGLTFTNLSISNSFYNLSNLDLYHISGTKIETLIRQGLSRLTFKPEIYTFIDNFSINRNDLNVDNEITDEYVNVKFENDDFRYELSNALKLSKEMNLNLIQYKEKCYIENIDDFITRKTSDLKLIYRKSIFDIQNKIFRISRNETNRRLDYNLTNMKSDLLDYLLLDDEELVELDISNAQFSILAFVAEGIDEDFITKAQNGTLYDNNKKDWFRVAFDKIRTTEIEKIYPKTINWINEFKKNNGYKSFSIMLQNIESMIMIDYLLPKLLDKGYTIFTIHDAVRVKKSQVSEVKELIENYFNEINFKCNIRIKNKSEIINYKGFKNVEIDKITPEDKKLFISLINSLKSENIEPSEDIIVSLNYWCKYKSWFLYDKWLKTQKVIITEDTQ